MTDDIKATGTAIDAEGVCNAPAGDPGGTIFDLLGEEPPHAPADDPGKSIADRLKELPQQPESTPQENQARRVRIIEAAGDSGKFGKLAEKAAESRQRMQDIGGTLRASMQPFTFDMSKLGMIDRVQMRPLIERFKPVFDFYEEIEKLQPYLQEELKKPEYEEALPFIREAFDDPEYNELCIEDIIDYEFTTAGALTQALQAQEPPADSLTFKAVAAARAAALIQARAAGRATRQQLKSDAQAINAIMCLSGGNYPIFSKRELWDAFAPGRICKMGTLNPAYIDEKTGAVKKQVSYESGEIIPLDADEISLKAYLLLCSILGNSVDNVREEFIKDGRITFYVKGVLQAFTDDPRTLTDEQLNLDRKTAGALYLENLFKPLQEYIGTTENGSRWSVFNYIGYNAANDTMTIQTPYIYKLWEATQGAYFARLKRIEAARSNNKKPAKADLKPLEINSLFKGKAYNAHPTTLEIAIYITNVLLTAGNNGTQKKTEISYRTLIKNCPRLNNSLSDIEARPNIETTPDGKTINNARRYNDELKKIKSAFDLILDPEKCDATNKYDFINIEPSKIKKNGQQEIIPPTKSQLNGKITIHWRRKDDEQTQ